MTTKKVISILLICTLLLCGCSSVTQYDSTSSQLEKGITESTEETANHQDPLDEDERFLELFEGCYEEYKQKGLGCRMEYAELEDIWQANSDNEMMRNLYYFCNACGYYWLADITDDEELKSNGNSEAAKIDPNYDGPYADEVITFAKELLGESYEEEAARAVEEQKNYDNLSMMDKVDMQRFFPQLALLKTRPNRVRMLSIRILQKPNPQSVLSRWMMKWFPTCRI